MFLAKIQKILHLKGKETDKWELIKIKSISSSKDPIKELNKKITDWGKNLHNLYT